MSHKHLCSDIFIQKNDRTVKPKMESKSYSRALSTCILEQTMVGDVQFGFFFKINWLQLWACQVFFLSCSRIYLSNLASVFHHVLPYNSLQCFGDVASKRYWPIL